MATYSSKKYPLPAGSITSTTLADGTVAAVDIASGAIGATQLASSAVTNAKLASTAVSIDKVDNTVTQLFGMRNRIINGAMTIAQRGSVNVVAGGSNTYIAADRFSVFNYFGSGQINTAISTSVVPAGFSSSIGLTVSTAVPLNGSTGYLVNIAQTIEGFNIADCYNQPITLSFWVRSSITGTYSVCFYNASNAGATSATRWYVANYTINAANTWEQKTITVNLSAGTASGTWLSDNGVGLNIAWGLGAESNRKGDTYLNTWGTVGTTYSFQSSSQTQWASTAGATFYITGVQLEKGSAATSFDYRPYGTELLLCQRYFENTRVGGYSKGGHGNANTGCKYFVKKRTSPTITANGSGIWAYDGSSATYNTQSWGDSGYAWGASDEYATFYAFANQGHVWNYPVLISAEL